MVAAPVLLMLGCGGSESSRSTSIARAPQPFLSAAKPKDGEPPGQNSSRTKQGEAQPVIPTGGASPPQVRQIETLKEQFPPPKPSKVVKGSAAVIEAGKAACRGKTPLQIREEFYAAAKGNLEAGQAKMVAELPEYEAEAAEDPSFVAGQLGAMIYEMTLAKEIQTYGFQGCVYELARQLEREIAR